MYAPSSVAQAAIPNPDQITRMLSKLEPDAALKQYATMHKNDPYIMSLAVAEANRRKSLRARPMQQQPTVVDQNIASMAPAPAPVPQQMPPQQMAQQQRLPEQQGIGALPARNIENMADGGIAGYADGEVPGYADRGAVEDYRQAIIDEAQLQGVPASVALQISGVESNFNPTAKPIDPKTGKLRSSATSFFQVVDKTFKSLGGDPSKRTDPMENIRVGVKSLAENQASLTKTLGRSPKPQELYATHFLGTNVGSKLLSADPTTPIGAFLDKTDPKNKEKILTANPEVLGGKKTVGDVLNWAQKKMAPIMTAAMPVGTAQADTQPASAQADTQPASAAAAPATAPAKGGGGAAFGMYPSAARGAKATPASEARITEQARQAMLGVGELPYDILGMPMDVSHQIRKVLGSKVPNENIIGTSAYLKKKATEAAIREADAKDPSLQKWRTAGEVAAAIPFPARAPTGLARLAPAAEAAKAAKAAEAGVEAKVAGIAALSPVQEAAQATRIAKQAEAQKQVAPQVGARPQDPAAVSEAEAYVRAEQAELAAQQVTKSPAQAWAAQQQQDLAAIRPAVSPAAAAPARGAPLEVAPMSEIAQTGRAQVSPAVASHTENATSVIGDSFASTGAPWNKQIIDRDFADKAAIPPEVKKEAVAAAKEEIPKSERKGFGYEDLMMFGLQLLASKSPHFGQAVGEAGVGAIGAKMAREKGETERIKEGAMADYYKEHGAYLKSEAARKAEEDKPLAQARKEIAAELLKLQSNTLYQMAPPAERQAMERSARQAIMWQYPELAGTLGGTGGADFRVLGSRPS